MNKLIIMFFLLVFGCQQLKSQNDVHVNWTLLINETLASAQIMRSMFIVKMTDSTPAYLQYLVLCRQFRS